MDNLPEIASAFVDTPSDPGLEADLAPTPERPPVSSFRLNAVARDQLARLADQAGLSATKMVEALIARAIDDPEGYYSRLGAHYALISAGAGLALASVTNPALAAALSRTLPAQAALALGPLPPRPADLPDAPDSGPVADLLKALEGLTSAARAGHQ